MTRSAFLTRILAALPFLGWVVPKVAEPAPPPERVVWPDVSGNGNDLVTPPGIPGPTMDYTVAEDLEGLGDLGSWDALEDYDDVSWELVIPGDGQFSVRVRYVDSACTTKEWSVLDSSGRERYRGDREPIVRSHP